MAIKRGWYKKRKRQMKRNYNSRETLLEQNMDILSETIRLGTKFRPGWSF